MQHSTGDCWLLSGINAMSYTETGREIIKNAIEPCDGGAIIHLKGARDYFITEKAVNQASVSAYYSSGDLDMIYLELAIESVRNDAATGNLVTPDDSPWYVPDEESEESEKGYSSTNGGLHPEVVYIITGKDSESYHSKEEIKTNLLRIEDNGNKNLAASIDLNTEKSVKDYDGNDITLPGGHAYALKSVDGDCVTFTNPWDSGKDIKVNIDVFSEDVCDWLIITDLSDNNKSENYMRPVRKTETEQYGYKTETATDKNGNVIKTDEFDPEGRTINTKKYDDDGKITSEKSYGYLSTGNLRLKNVYEFGENENISKQTITVFGEDETLESETNKFFDENENLTERVRNKYDGNERVEHSDVKYGENGKVAEETRMTYKDNQIDTLIKSLYDENGNLTEDCRKSYKDGKLCEDEKISYDNKGNISSASLKIYDEEGILRSSNTVFFKTDGTKDYEEVITYDNEGNEKSRKIIND